MKAKEKDTKERANTKEKDKERATEDTKEKDKERATEDTEEKERKGPHRTQRKRKKDTMDMAKVQLDKAILSA